jgi:hypothetical protein
MWFFRCLRTEPFWLSLKGGVGEWRNGEYHIPPFKGRIRYSPFPVLNIAFEVITIRWIAAFLIIQQVSKNKKYHTLQNIGPQINISMNTPSFQIPVVSNAAERN